MKKFFILILIYLAPISISLANSADKEIQQIDLKKYQGTWFELARSPNMFQIKCQFSAMDFTLSKAKKDKFIISNICLGFDGKNKKRIVPASIIKKDLTLRSLYISHHPIMNISRIFSSEPNYYIFYVDETYAITIAGSPDKSSFWILSKDQKKPHDINRILDMATFFGFNMKDIIISNPNSNVRNKILDLVPVP